MKILRMEIQNYQTISKDLIFHLITIITKIGILLINLYFSQACTFISFNVLQNIDVNVQIRNIFNNYKGYIIWR